MNTTKEKIMAVTMSLTGIAFFFTFGVYLLKNISKMPYFGSY